MTVKISWMRNPGNPMIQEATMLTITPERSMIPDWRRVSMLSRSLAMVWLDSAELARILSEMAISPGYRNS